MEKKKQDMVNSPDHYAKSDFKFKSCECIDVAEWMPFCYGNAFKYIWRAGNKDKSKTMQDLDKAVWYVKRQKNLAKLDLTMAQNVFSLIEFDITSELFSKRWSALNALFTKNEEIIFEQIENLRKALDK